MDMFRNSDLVENIVMAGNIMTVQGNGGTLSVTQNSTVPGYKDVCGLAKMI